MKLAFIAIASFLLILAKIYTINADGGKVVCFYAQWSAKRTPSRKYTVQDINPTLCTHFVYAYAELIGNRQTIVPKDEYLDITHHAYRDFVGIRTKTNENVKLLVGVGGYADDASKFSTISKNRQNRRVFAGNVLNFLRTHGFDGINIGWQYPTSGGTNSIPEDYDNFVYLLEEMNNTFMNEAAERGRDKLLLSISTPGYVVSLRSGFHLEEIENHVDFINILCYDYHYSFDPAVYHHSPLYPLPEEYNNHENELLNVDATIKHILRRVRDLEKLIFGIALYAITYSLENENYHDLGAPAMGGGYIGDETEFGYLAYYEVCEREKTGWNVIHHNKTAMGPYAFKGNQWMSYDDEDSARRKGEYAKRRGLGGLSFWSIDLDDYKGNCGPKAYPIINAAKDGYNKAIAPHSPRPQRLVVTPSPTGQLSPSAYGPVSEPSTNLEVPHVNQVGSIDNTPTMNVFQQEMNHSPNIEVPHVISTSLGPNFSIDKIKEFFQNQNHQGMGNGSTKEAIEHQNSTDTSDGGEKKVYVTKYNKTFHSTSPDKYVETKYHTVQTTIHSNNNAPTNEQISDIFQGSSFPSGIFSSGSFPSDIFPKDFFDKKTSEPQFNIEEN